MSADVHVVVGGQWGSEAKGATAAFLTEWLDGNGERSHSVRIGGPNAGHTVYDDGGREWKLRQVPVGVVKDHHAGMIIAAGSEIDLPVLLDEVEQLDAAGHNASARIMVDSQITMITDEHKQQEAELVGKIGSTGKGIGAARAARMLRRAPLAGDQDSGVPRDWLTDTTKFMMDELKDDIHLVVESTQGFGLGLHAGHYPKCTSGNVRAIDGMAQIGISPWAPYVNRVVPWVVLRTYPIRVAGNSGPMHNEKTWDELGLPEERTTVTNKVRRVGEWDLDLARDAVEANGGQAARISLCMVDQMFPDNAHQANLTEEAEAWIKQVEQDLDAGVWIVGTGPTTHTWRREPASL